MDIPETPKKGGPSRKRYGRRKAMDPQEIADLKAQLASTPKKPRNPGKNIPDESLETRQITIPARGNVGGWSFKTPPASKEYWDSNFSEWQKRMEELQIYFTIFNKEIEKEDRQIIFNGVVNYITWLESKNLAQQAEIHMQLGETLQAIIPQPTWNPAKAVPWLVQNWPQIHQYLVQGNIYELSTPELTDPTILEEPDEGEFWRPKEWEDISEEELLEQLKEIE